MTLAVTGDAGKTLVLQRNLARFGIVQLARTGTVSLKRGSLLLEVTASLRSVDEGDSGVSGTGADLSPAALQALAEQQSASTALWEAKQVRRRASVGHGPSVGQTPWRGVSHRTCG